LSLGLITAGTAMVVGRNALRDDVGYVTTTERPVSSSGYAVTVTSVVIDSPTAANVPQRVLGDVRLRVDPAADRAMFVGIGPSAQVERYLDGVARTLLGSNPPADRDVSGGPPAVPPEQAPIWAAHSVGIGTQDLVWTPRAGDWSVVLMNADGFGGGRRGHERRCHIPLAGDGRGLSLALGVLLLVAGATSVGLAAHLCSPPVRPPVTRAGSAPPSA
jgi:hypothetical protein